MIKAIFLDLDGTLLDGDSKVSPATRAALERCKQKGLRLFIATGRPPLLPSMLGWDDALCGLFDGGTYYNGGCVILGERKEYTPVSDVIIQAAVKSCEALPGLNICLQLEGEKHAFRYPLPEKYYEFWGITREHILDFDRIYGEKTIKFMAYDANLIDSVKMIPETVKNELGNLCKNKAYYYLTDRGKTVLISGLRANKLDGVEKIRLACGLEKDEIAVFGDDANDVEMLAAYPRSFAMGNALRSVKSAAKNITLDNNSDGVAHALRHILNL